MPDINHPATKEKAAHGPLFPFVTGALQLDRQLTPFHAFPLGAHGRTASYWLSRPWPVIGLPELLPRPAPVLGPGQRQVLLPRQHPEISPAGCPTDALTDGLAGGVAALPLFVSDKTSALKSTTGILPETVFLLHGLCRIGCTGGWSVRHARCLSWKRYQSRKPLSPAERQG